MMATGSLLTGWLVFAALAGGCSSTTKPATDNAVAWQTSTVSLTADNFWIVANGLQFIGKPAAAVEVHSDPGEPTYTTLELTWAEQGREMRFFMYFHADPTGWWSDEMRTYDGQANADWLFYSGTFFRSPVGASFRGDVDLTNNADPTQPTVPPFPGELHLHGLELSTTLHGA